MLMLTGARPAQDPACAAAWLGCKQGFGKWWASQQRWPAELWGISPENKPQALPGSAGAAGGDARLHQPLSWELMPHQS